MICVNLQVRVIYTYKNAYWSNLKPQQLLELTPKLVWIRCFYIATYIFTTNTITQKPPWHYLEFMCESFFCLLRERLETDRDTYTHSCFCTLILLIFPSTRKKKDQDWTLVLKTAIRPYFKTLMCSHAHKSQFNSWSDCSCYWLS